jgi:DNA mismatch endonuclease (patch repair protein)
MRMSLIRSKNTKPERAVRSLVHRMGFRYRLNARGLPGNPDLVFPSRRKIIFVHGCFWHLHRSCPNCRPPKSKRRYWGPKLQGNVRRDAANRRQLRRAGWRSLVVWECQIESDPEAVARRIARFLGKL